MITACSYGYELPAAWALGFGVKKSLPYPNALAPNTRYVMAGVTAVSWSINFAINIVDLPKKRTCGLDQRIPGSGTLKNNVIRSKLPRMTSLRAFSAILRLAACSELSSSSGSISFEGPSRRAKSSFTMTSLLLSSSATVGNEA